MVEVRTAVPGAGELQERHHMGTPFAAAWRSTTQALGNGAPGGIVLVAQCPDITPAILREAEGSTTNHTGRRLM